MGFLWVERGEASTIEAVARYVQTIGGPIQISAIFGDDHSILILRSTVTEATGAGYDLRAASKLAGIQLDHA